MVLLIQESKLNSCTERVIKKFWGNENCHWRVSNAFGHLGGIISVWNSDILISCIDFIEGAFLINCLFANKSNGFQWSLSNVYGLCNSME